MCKVILHCTWQARRPHRGGLGLKYARRRFFTRESLPHIYSRVGGSTLSDAMATRGTIGFYICSESFMKGKTIAILEHRLGEQMAELVTKYGGTPFWAPALAEVPDIDLVHIRALFDQWDASPPNVFIFQTGAGATAFFRAAETLKLTGKLLALLQAAQIAVRGPKPAAVLRSHQVRIDHSAKEPYTTTEVIAALEPVALRGARVVVQRYGETNWELQKILQEKHAEVIEIATYRWGLPENTRPLVELMDALERNEIDVVAFTSASQAVNLFAVAAHSSRQEILRTSLKRTLVASIGPVCTAALHKLGITVDIEPHPPKLGAFVAAITQELSRP